MIGAYAFPNDHNIAFLWGRLCSVGRSSYVKAGWSGDTQIVCKSDSGASLWTMSVFWSLLGQGSHLQALPVSLVIHCCLTELASGGSIQLLKFRPHAWHLGWLPEGPWGIHMGVCNWETLHISGAAFMEDLHTMISKCLTKHPVYTRMISTIRVKSPFIDLQIEG